MDDVYYMRKALEQAQIAYDNNEIPVGAVLVANNQIISKSYNQVEKWCDITAHAEILAITATSNHLQSKYLSDCTLYVTLEPCVMCSGALFWSQIGRIVYGASDDKRGGINRNPTLIHPKTIVTAGVLQHECSEIIKKFFQKIRF